MALNLLNYVMEHPCVEISPINPNPPTPNVDSIIMYQFSHTYMNPVDESTYYIGYMPNTPAQSITSPSGRVKSLVTGFAKEITLSTQIMGNIGTTQSQSFVLRNYTTGASASIVTDYKHESNSQNDNFDLTIPLTVNKDDELEIVWTTPAFEIEPTLVSHNMIVYIEY